MSTGGGPTRVAVVTGAGSRSGIGFAAATALLSGGCAVVVSATGPHVHERADDLVRSGGTHDPQVLGHVADLTDPAAAAGLVEAAVARFGRLDVVVNNAGMAMQGDLDPDVAVGSMSDAQWAGVLRRNLDTCFHVTRAAMVHLERSGTARVVNVASTTGPISAMPDQSAYAAAKAGMVGFTRALALELAPLGGTANAVAPGWIATGSATDDELRHGAAGPMGRSGTPEEVGAVVAFLAGTAASYVTGQCLVVDGGNSVIEARGV